ncbi:MAG: cyclodeaminase/cyclohydrolase family protein [Chloroflexi bacterium]|nr:cyclodeaminase/cyclohydrolase family protein [Chloroflexota bacterium]
MATDGARGVRAYLDEVAAGTPTPGGGSVAAVVGALAAALGEMVANLTLGREKYANAEEALRPAAARLSALRTALLAAATADEAAYQAYRDASSLPRGSDAEKTARTKTMQSTLVEAAKVPLAVARAAHEVAGILELVAREGNPHVRSDAALAAILSDAALRGALLNVRGNAALLEDRERAAAYLADADQLEVQGREAAERAYRTAMRASAESGFR